MFETPINIAGTILKNRIGFAPINTGLFQPIDRIQALALPFYKQYIENGLGLIYLGGISVSKEGRANSSSIVLQDNDSNAIKNIVALSKAQNVKTIFQIEHAGRQADPKATGGVLFAPSAIACPVVGKTPVELTPNQIKDVVANFATSAKTAMDIGADLVEIHAAHGYLLSGFISPYSNKRTDEYGGNIANRFRIVYEVVEAIKKATSIPFGIRVNCTDNVKDGITLSDILQGLEAIKNHLAYVSIAGGMYSPYEDVIIPKPEKGRVIWRKYTAIIRKELNIPIFICGNISNMADADNILKNYEADIVLIGRSLLADPSLLIKDSKISEINKCTYCHLCKYHSKGYPHIYCPLNPVLSNCKLIN